MKAPERLHIDVQNMAVTAYSFEFLGHIEYVRKDLADNQANELAQMVITTLKEKALDGCKDKSWSNFENGNGENVGKDIDSLIKLAKKIINSRKAETDVAKDITRLVTQKEAELLEAAEYALTTFYGIGCTDEADIVQALKKAISNY